MSNTDPGRFDAFSSAGVTDPFGDLFSSNKPAPLAYSRDSPFSSVSPPSTLSKSPSNARSGCSCLQRLIRLLYHLEELHFIQGPLDDHATRGHKARGPSADSVLRGVRAAKTPWQLFIQCSVHGDDESHREALLLFAMSIRILLMAIQKLNSSIDVNQNETSSDIVVSVGNFELDGEVKAEIIGVVVQRALLAITIALQYLWESTGHPTSRVGNEPANSNPRHPVPSAF